MILSSPAPALRNLPVVSLALPIELQGLNAAKTIPFKNVLDSLEALEAPGDENAVDEQKTAFQSVPTKFHGPSAGFSGALATKKNSLDPTPEQPQDSAPQQPSQYVAPQIPFPSQNLAQLTATLTRPTGETAVEPQKPSSTPDAFQPSSNDVAQQEPKEPTMTKDVQRPGVEKTAVSNSLITSVPARSTPLPSISTVSPKTSPIAMPAPAATSIASPRVVTTSLVPIPTSQAAAPTKPQAMHIRSGPPVPVAEHQQAAPQKIAQSPEQQEPEAGPAVAVAKPQTVESATPVIVPPSTEAEEAAPVTTSAAIPVTPPLATPTTPAPITTAAPAPVAQPPAPVAKQKDASPRRVTSPDPVHLDSTPTIAPPVPSAVVERSEGTKPEPEPEPAKASATPAAAHGEAAKTAIGESVVAPKTPLEAKAENIAFAVRMISPDTSDAQVQPVVSLAEPQVSDPKPAVPQAKPAPAAETQEPQSQASSNTKRETASPSPAPASGKTDTRAPKIADLPQQVGSRETVTRWSEISMPQPSEVSRTGFSTELAEPAHASAALAAQETHLAAPELPKTSASSEILLHLTGNDQSSAAIRVAERAGTVNVTVHASDPTLRESLRSNLGELSAQLSQQGWKAETVKPAATAAQPESQQDSHTGGQRSSQQQQSSAGDRQQQRDRRTPGGHWQQELEQQITSGNAPGGNR